MALDLANIKSVVGLKSGATIKQIQCGSDGKVLWSAGAIVTYMVDNDVAYTEEVDSGATCLSPTSFTPTKSGYSFLGWREDATASGTVLSTKEMGTEPIVLYAVFMRRIILSYDGNGSTSGSTSPQSGIQYYNNGNMENPKFTLASSGFTKTDYEFTAWASTDGTQYDAGASIALSEDTTFYAVWTALAQPWTWVQNYVATDGNTLTLTQSSSVNTSASVDGLTIFQTPIIYAEEEGNWKIVGHTNTVNVKKNTTMKIVIAYIYGGQTFVKVNGNTIATADDGSGTYTVEVTENSDVRIDFEVGAWAYSSGSPALNISEISFY